MSERFSRQKDLVPKDALKLCNITIVGVGAIGRQVALQLSAMGAENLLLIDHDSVEESNLASQGYYENDLGKPKVIATGEVCNLINSSVRVKQLYNRFRKSEKVGNVLFCCVDKIHTRKFIWGAVKENIKFFVDGRMSGETLRIIAASDTLPKTKDHYSSTLFDSEDAHQGSCTAKTTIYCANIAAGRMISKFTLWLRGIPFEQDILLNLISDEITANI